MPIAEASARVSACAFAIRARLHVLVERQRDGGQDSDDRDHDEQLDQRETGLPSQQSHVSDPSHRCSPFVTVNSARCQRPPTAE